MTTNYPETTKPAISKRRRIFAKTFGIPGFVFSFISAWFVLIQSVVAMTASGITEFVATRFISLSFYEFLSIPVLALCACTIFWAAISIVLCVLSRFLGTSTKINQAGLIISVVTLICSASLGGFSVIYMLFI